MRMWSHSAREELRWHSMTNKHQDFVNEKYPNEIREYAKRMKIKRKGDYLKYRHFKTFVVADK